MRFGTTIVGIISVLALTASTFVPEDAMAVPAFARRYEMSCRNCHQGHYPRLNSFGRRFRENGFQMPDGAEDPVRARRQVEPGTRAEKLSIFKEVPLGFRGEVFGVVPMDAAVQERPAYENRIFSFIFGGGSIYEDVSFFFSWTPFPEPLLHHAKLGVHNIGEEVLGSGTLNVRAGSFFLLDFQRPSHRFLASGANASEQVTVGLNRFAVGESTLGVTAYGRPGWGPFFYEVSVVAGDPGDGMERDDWKDIFARATWTAFQNTEHEVTLGGFGYLGRSDILTEAGGASLALRDDFWIAGVEGEADFGPVNVFAMAYGSRHDGATVAGTPVTFFAGRSEVLWSVTNDLVASVRYDFVESSDDPSLNSQQIAPHLTYLLATNFVATLVWRQDLRNFDETTLVGVLDVAF